MGMLTHIRFRIWDHQRYTKAQAAEMQQLHEIYAEHLAGHEPITATALALSEEGDSFFYPALEQVSLTPGGAQRALNAQGGGRLLPFARSLMQSVAVFSARRDQRWYKKGHDNDPTRLFCAFLQDFFQQQLVSARCDQETLDRLQALKSFLAAVRMQQVFQQEPENHASMTLLLHNLDRKLDESIETVRHYLDLHAAREAFDLLQQQTRGVLDHAVQFLFYSVSDRDKQRLDFSLLSYYTTTDDRLEKALDTKAGHLLKRLMAAKVMQAIVKPGERVNQSVKPALGLPIALLNPPAEDAFLDEAAQVNEGLIDLLAGKSKGVSKAARSLVGDVVEQVKKDRILLEKFIHLHSFVEVFAEYSALVEDFWKLAGFGGDQFIYHQLAEVVQTLMGEFQGFNQSFAQALKGFSQTLSLCFNDAVAQGKSKQWQANYQQGQQFSQKVLASLKQSQKSLGHIIQKTSNTPEKYQQHQRMQLAYEHVQNAQALIQKARLQAGREAFNGAAWTQDFPALPSIEAEEAQAHATNREPPELPATIQDILKPLVGSKRDHVDFLNSYQSDVIKPPGLSCWVGSWTRYRYFHDIERFRSLFQSMRLLQGNHFAQLEQTAEALVQIQTARACIRDEFARVLASRQRLWWPFQRKSIAFLGLWQEIFIGVQSELHALEAKASKAHQAHVQVQALAKALVDLTPLFDRNHASVNTLMALQGKTVVFETYQDNLARQKIHTAAKDYIAQIPSQGLGAAEQEFAIHQVILAIQDQETTDDYYRAHVAYLLDKKGLAGLVSKQHLLKGIADHDNLHLIDQLCGVIQDKIKASVLSEVSQFYIALKLLKITAFKPCLMLCQERLQLASVGIAAPGIQGAFFPRPKEPSERYCAVSPEACDQYLSAQSHLVDQLRQHYQGLS